MPAEIPGLPLRPLNQDFASWGLEWKEGRGLLSMANHSPIAKETVPFTSSPKDESYAQGMWETTASFRLIGYAHFWPFTTPPPPPTSIV